MGFAVSLVCIAIGAILKFAVSVDSSGFNINTAGVILMVVGVIGLIASAVLMTMRRRRDVIHEGPAGTSRTTYSEPPPAAY
ncbi:MAG TPA: DUF6458 family protein [Mycobacterium sp.]|jgi:uncharacterized membrane protein YhaH (DUF805 family)|nr:DUF6458 family protein [Mycobacterium sp.]